VKRAVDSSRTSAMALAQPASPSLFALSSDEIRLFVRAWMLGFLIVLLIIG